MRAAAQRIQEFTKLLTDKESLRALEEMIEHYPDILKRGPTHPLVYDESGVLRWKSDPTAVARMNPDHTKWMMCDAKKCRVAMALGYSLGEYVYLPFVESYQSTVWFDEEDN